MITFPLLNRVRASLLVILALPGLLYADFPLRVQTDLGSFDILMLDSVAPATVTNFMNYVNQEEYDGTFLHRNVPGFVVQGGGFRFDEKRGGFLNGGSGVENINFATPVKNEFGRSNLRGTLAMAKSSGDPDSATSQFFFNLADNSANLDNQNGGFTVFAEVQGNGMTVVDEIAMLPRCNQFFGTGCGTIFTTDSVFSSSDTPLADGGGIADNTALVNIFIGTDDDLDGVIDRHEDLAPNNGDGNNDGTPDSQQRHVASYRDEFGNPVILESPPATPVEDVSVISITFRRAHAPAQGSTLESQLALGSEFCNGGAGFRHSVGTGGSVAVTMTLPAGVVPDSYYNYGPTATDTTPHWYEFAYDPMTGTGAQINNNVVTLHYVDGERGDSDLDNTNGVIVSPPGGPLMADDQDGVSCVVENGGPGQGDGNQDGIPDSQQANVTSLRDISNNYVTLEAMNPAHAFSAVLGTPDGSGALVFDIFGNLVSPVPDWLTALNLFGGFLEFDITGVTPGGSADVRMTFQNGAIPTTYAKYGPTPSDPNDHFYEFLYDPTSSDPTGAEFNGNTVTLHFVDGGRGDADLLMDGRITDPGAPAVPAAVSSPGGGGCSLAAGYDRPAGSGGHWLLLLTLLLALRFVQRSRVLH